MNKAGFYTSEYMYINNVKVGSLFTSFVLQLHVFSIIDILILVVIKQQEQTVSF